jgi:hypothetical protein
LGGEAAGLGGEVAEAVEAAATGAGGAAFGSGAFIDIGRVATAGLDPARPSLSGHRERYRHRGISPPLAQCTLPCRS